MIYGIFPADGGFMTFTGERSTAVHTELDAILKSSHFSGSKRCHDFLEFIVRQALEGNKVFLTERFLGAELFGRPIDYETGSDSIVRVRANDVRRRLAEYYSEQLPASKVTIRLPSGSYVPEFHWREDEERKVVETAPAELAHTEADTKLGASADGSGTAHDVISDARPARGRRWVFAWLIAAALVLGCCTGWWLKQHAVDSLLHPWKHGPSMESLWSGFMDSNRPTDVVLSDTSFQVVEDLGKQSFTLDDYRDRSYLSQLDAEPLSHDVRSAVDQIASKNYGSSVEFVLARRILALDPMGNRIHIYNARDYSAALVTQDNLILIGSPYTNPWDELFDGQLNFAEQQLKNVRGPVLNRAPKSGEKASYTPTDSVGYCIVAYLRNRDTGAKVLLIEGTSSEATVAGGDFLLSDEKLAGFKKMLHTGKLPYFEVLLKTAQVRSTPIAATIEAYRTHPG